MARVKSFRIHPQYGVPDKDIREWLNVCEKEEGIITVVTTLIPPIAESDPRLNIIVTKLDDRLGSPEIIHGIVEEPTDA